MRDMLASGAYEDARMSFPPEAWAESLGLGQPAFMRRQKYRNVQYG